VHVLLRFPNIAPGQQKEVGDHFLALFPVQATADATKLPAANIASGLRSGGEGMDNSGENHNQQQQQVISKRWSRRLFWPTWTADNSNPIKTTAAVGADAQRHRHPMLSACPEISRDSTFRMWMQPLNPVGTQRPSPRTETVSAVPSLGYRHRDQSNGRVGGMGGGWMGRWLRWWKEQRS
jgi:hypothetical protein